MFNIFCLHLSFVSKQKKSSPIIFLLEFKTATLWWWHLIGATYWSSRKRVREGRVPSFF